MEEIKLRFVSTTKDATVTGTIKVAREDEVLTRLKKNDGFMEIIQDDGEATWVNLANVFHVSKVSENAGEYVHVL